MGENTGRWERLSDRLRVYRGALNAGVLIDGSRALVIDCGDGEVGDALSEIGVTRVDRLLFTHHHRDQACGAWRFVGAGARVGAPAAERAQFEDPMAYWRDDRNLWRVSASYRPHRLMLVDPLPVHDAVEEGDEFLYGGGRVRVLATPGHTDGSASYVVEIDGVRAVFVGDNVCGDGRVWDLHSLQRGFERGGRRIGAYHGFMGDRWRLSESLGKIAAAGADVLVPSHGDLVRDPAGAVARLEARLEGCYERYVAISALRHYFPELFLEYAGRPGQMPLREGFPPPPCLRHVGTTWALVSESGAAFVMDAGSSRIVGEVRGWIERGEISGVDALWVTHYHADHTDGIARFAGEFRCPIVADRRLAEVLVAPRSWRLPCLAPDAILVDRAIDDGTSWDWREYRMTSFEFPGQTLYHGALLVERGDLRMLFVGDSHTRGGIDDYCALNRNWLGRGVGFHRCLDLIERVRPTHMFNAHVDQAFAFTPGEIAAMRRNLDERERLFGEIVPWDHANYGLDASWARCEPCVQEARAGGVARFRVIVTNHSREARESAARVVPPRAFGGGPGEWGRARIRPGAEGVIDLAIALPAGLGVGRHVVPVDLRHGAWQLPQFIEAIVDVTDRR